MGEKEKSVPLWFYRQTKSPLDNAVQKNPQKDSIAWTEENYSGALSKLKSEINVLLRSAQNFSKDLNSIPIFQLGEEERFTLEMHNKSWRNYS